MAASLIRLHFHDCFVQGCDASILLDETVTIQSEKGAIPNANSVRGYDVIEAVKREIERACPGVVGGPWWNVWLGRRDSTTANKSQAETDLPSPFVDPNELILAFAIKGAHTIGQAQCFLFRERIYSNGSDVDVGFATTRRRRCPRNGGDGNLAALDVETPDLLDNKYFKNLVERKGLLQSDQVLFSGRHRVGIYKETASVCS
ncbi:hypothetical protein SASPL_130754 [Salvia splendens]|uniref:peroxidase n=1 Tax=Salvia splendens TaxID=180675 RepID=A0A8X8ZJZ5_SALSN|nr:hypothetical protein SASPL_130754 [Salvia splendens]